MQTHFEIGSLLHYRQLVVDFHLHKEMGYLYSIVQSSLAQKCLIFLCNFLLNTVKYIKNNLLLFAVLETQGYPSTATTTTTTLVASAVDLPINPTTTIATAAITTIIIKSDLKFIHFFWVHLIEKCNYTAVH